MSSVQPRLNRLFASDGKCFDVAIDHGFFNEQSFLTGIEDMPSAVQTIVEADPDAMQLTIGQAHHLQQLPGKQKPSLVLRADVANVYSTMLPERVFSQLIADPVEQALRLDAACVVVNLFMLPDQADLFHQCLVNISALKPQCERYGMPLMVEPRIMQPDERAGGYMVDGDLGKMLPLVRQAVKLGADVITAAPCDDVAKYARVVEMAGGVPVLVRGDGRAPDAEILARTHALMRQGAAGIVYGRKMLQHAKPRNLTQALMSIIHHGATPAQAVMILREDRV